MRLIAALCCLWLGQAAIAQAPADGALVSTDPCPPPAALSYDDWLDQQTRLQAQEIQRGRDRGHRVTMRPAEAYRQQLPSRAEFARRRAYAGFECRRIRYGSDGLNVAGFLWKPVTAAGQRLPVVVALRGGNRELSKFRPWTYDGMYAFVSAGFIVVGVQYRGADGGEGREEYGGRDVRDVLNALTLARSLPYVDANNVFLWGESRGGMMVYRALQEGAQVNAAVVLSGLSDLRPVVAERPEIDRNLAELVPNYADRRQEALDARSALLWIETVETPPILLLHGNRDWRAPVEQSVAMAMRLQALGRAYALHILDGGDHNLFDGWRERDRLTVDWLRNHLRPGPRGR